MTSSVMPEIGEVVAGKYEIEALLGEGGMGAVYLATNRFTSGQVALKWLLPELSTNEAAVQRFRREAHAAGRINHPNVVGIYDVGEQNGTPFLVMEYLDGESLTSALARGGLEPAQVVDVILRCIRGVAAAHKKGVIHRDLKPDNIVLCRGEDGHYLNPKLLDFGISKLSEGGEIDGLTKPGDVMGTPYYMSPEQIRALPDIDGRCDIYAFGVILYEALTGRVPFNADSYAALAVEIATGTATPPRDINEHIHPELSAVITRAMARNRDERYPTVEALGEALQPFAASVTFNPASPELTNPKLMLGTTTQTPFVTDTEVREHDAVPGLRRGRSWGWVAAALVIAVGGAYALAGTSTTTAPTSAATSTLAVPDTEQPEAELQTGDSAAVLSNQALTEPGMTEQLVEVEGTGTVQSLPDGKDAARIEQAAKESEQLPAVDSAGADPGEAPAVRAEPKAAPRRQKTASTKSTSKPAPRVARSKSPEPENTIDVIATKAQVNDTPPVVVSRVEPPKPEPRVVDQGAAGAGLENSQSSSRNSPAGRRPQTGTGRTGPLSVEEF